MFRSLIISLIISLFPAFCFADSLTNDLTINPMVIAIAEEGVQKGDINSMCILGLLYREGNHVQRNYVKAKELFRKCAEKDEPMCQLLLGEMYVQGQGAPINDQNDMKARQWLKKAATHNISDAQVRLGLMYQEGKGGEKNSAQARQLYEKAAQRNDLNGQFYLALAYLNGMGGKKDNTQAKVLAKKSCDNHNQRACKLYQDLNQ